VSKKRFFQRGEENTIKRISNDDPSLKIKIKKVPTTKRRKKRMG
jgi:hypothetical protein